MKRYLSAVLIFGLIFCMACNMPKRKNKRGEVVTKLKNSAKLATVEYVVTKVIKAEKDNFILKNSYFFAHTEATIKAGIDLNKLQEDDIKIEDDKISLTLPAIEIINFSYPAENFTMVDKYTTKPGLFSKQFTLAQKDELYRQGELAIRKNIESLGIIERAKINTRNLIEKVLLTSGFNEIYINFKEKKNITTDMESVETKSKN